jgi:hypothetical protein
MPGAGTETHVADNCINQMLIPHVPARNARYLGVAKLIFRELRLVLFSAELLAQQPEWHHLLHVSLTTAVRTVGKTNVSFSIQTAEHSILAHRISIKLSNVLWKLQRKTNQFMIVWYEQVTLSL